MPFPQGRLTVVLLQEASVAHVVDTNSAVPASHGHCHAIRMELGTLQLPARTTATTCTHALRVIYSFKQSFAMSCLMKLHKILQRKTVVSEIWRRVATDLGGYGDTRDTGSKAAVKSAKNVNKQRTTTSMTTVWRRGLKGLYAVLELLHVAREHMQLLCATIGTLCGAGRSCHRQQEY